LGARIAFLSGHKLCYVDAVADGLDMDLIYQGIDSFKLCSNVASFSLVEADDVELEAKSEAHIGDIYFRALKFNKKARPHL